MEELRQSAKRPRIVRFRGHPLHPLMTHLPIGMWVSGSVWDAVALWTRSPEWWRLSFWALVLGLAAAVPAAIVGFIDYLGIPGHTPAEKTATYHLSAVSAAAVAYLGSVLVRGGPGLPAAEVAAVALAAAGLLSLTIGGWLGAELVYRHRVGVHDAGGRDE